MATILLLNRHLIIPAVMAAGFVGEASHVNMVYYPGRNTLMLAPATDELFKSLHKTTMQMLKNKNLAGDKSISLEEMLIDNELDDRDRELGFQLDAMNIMQVFFK
jgi:hypothetical protein